MVVDYTKIATVLLWLATGGSVFVVNWIAANFLEKQAWWNKLPLTLKYIIPPIAAVVLGLLAGEVVTLEAIAVIAPYWEKAMLIIMAYFGSQLGHIQTKDKVS
jgi:hypothetical protein